MKRPLLVMCCLVVAFFYFTCMRRVDKDNPNYYRENFTISYSPLGNWFAVGQTNLPDVSYLSFQVVGEYYGKDKRQVYYEARPIIGADPATFTMLGTFTAKDARNVYRYGKRVPDLLPQGARVVPPDKPGYYGESYLMNDEGTYWLGGSSSPDDFVFALKIPVHRRNNFEVLDAASNLSGEMHQLFYKTTPYPVKRAEDFVQVYNYLYSFAPAFVNGGALYITHYKDTVGSINQKFPVTVKPFSNVYLHTYRGVHSFIGDYGFVVFNKKHLAYVTPTSETFEYVTMGKTDIILKDMYAFVDDAVYCATHLMRKAGEVAVIPNPTGAFRMLPESASRLSNYAVDNDVVYYNCKKLEGADPASFMLETDKDRQSRVDARDKNRQYSMGHVVVPEQPRKP